MNSRLQNLEIRTKSLTNLSDSDIVILFENSANKNEGIGGESKVVRIDSNEYFCKRLYLTQQEMKTENQHSTKNIFSLPLYYQYGVGSAGFGAWRELQSHIIASKWVYRDEIPSFPLLYHWRVIENIPHEMTKIKEEKLEKDVVYWENSSAIRERLRGLFESPASIFIFLECYPTRLFDWIKSKLKSDERVLEQIELELHAVNRFMASKGFIHFDAHFRNLLTDGQNIIFSDFGLALSRDFSLSNEEETFFETHQNYDLASTMVNLLHCIVVNSLEEKRWPSILYSDREFTDICTTIQPLAQKIRPISQIMNKFYTDLRFKSKKTTLYPENEIRDALKKLTG